MRATRNVNSETNRQRKEKEREKEGERDTRKQSETNCFLCKLNFNGYLLAVIFCMHATRISFGGSVFNTEFFF